MKTINPVYKSLAFLFAVITLVCLLFAKQLDALQVNHFVLIIANSILFLLTLITATLQIKSSAKKSAYAFVGSISVSVFLKLIVIAGSVIIYMLSSAKNKSIYAVAAAMFFYILYTIFEVKGILKMNKKANAFR